MEIGGDANAERFNLPDFNFWSAYSSLKERISALKRKRSPILSDQSLCQICIDIEEEILNHDEENLSPLQNKIRKLNVGSDLCRDICLLQRYFRNLEINKAVSHLLEEGRYSSIAKKILQRKGKELKNEKYFQRKALDTIKESFEDENEKGEVINDVVNGGDRSETYKPQERQIISETGSREIRESITDNELADKLRLEILRRGTSGSFIQENLENIRALNENSVGAGLRLSELPPYQDESFPELLARQNAKESELNIVLKDIEHILAEENADLPRGSISEPLGEKQLEISETLNNNRAGSDDLSDLPEITVLSQERKRRLPPVFDHSTVIPDYADRARRLNRSITVGRIQVYEGPPSILQAFTIGHLMTTTCVKNVFSHITRSSVIDRLYARHLVTRKVSSAEMDNDFRRFVVARQSDEEEKTESKRELQSMAGRPQLKDISDIEEQIIPENNVREFEIGSLRGTSVSRLLQKEITPPSAIGKSIPWVPPGSPRLENLQGTRIEEPISEAWFMSINQPVPSEKWREFKFVRNCLEKIWKRQEESNLEKSTTLREILECEQDSNRENMLTLLRILDKLSIRREIILKGTGTNMKVYPYEIPYVTEGQYSLRQEIQKF